MAYEIIQPRTSQTRYGRSLTGRQQAFVYQQKTAKTVQLTLYDDAGNAKDLSQYDTTESSESGSDGDYTARFLAYEASQRETIAVDLDVEVYDAANGVVRFDFKSELNAGIYVGEVQFVDAEDYVLSVDRVWVYCEPRIQGQADRAYMPSIREVRLYLRDSMPDESFYSDELEFDLPEICQAMSQCVEFWSSTPPPVANYTTTTFPFRAQWLEGMSGLVMRGVAEFYRRNDVPSDTGGGMNIRDMAKAKEYDQEGKERWARFQAFTLEKKMQINLRGCMGQVG